MRVTVLLTMLLIGSVSAQESIYQNTLPADPPYYRIRYEASTEPGELIYPASFTMWVPAGVKTLRGLIVHQHGCGEGSCKSGQTGAFDLHWQALAKKHDCALLAPVFEQPDKADCQMWCDPRNGSDATFQRSLTELGRLSEHPELASAPWALWGHSGGGHWAGGMVLLHPERVAAAWLRSGVPALTAAEGKPRPYEIPDEACKVPVMCNLGTQEGVTDKTGRFAGVWPGVETFFRALRARGGLVAVSIDPNSSHDCGNQRYLAMPWFDACLTARLPIQPGAPMLEMTAESGWLTPLNPGESVPVPAAAYQSDRESAVWLPTQTVAIAWAQYMLDSAVSDTTPPPDPTDLRVSGCELSWSAEADLESGLAGFIIDRDGMVLANVPEQGKNSFGRPIFQNLSYSDTPTQPLAQMRFTDTTAEPGKTYRYRVFAVNSTGLKSQRAAEQLP